MSSDFVEAVNECAKNLEEGLKVACGSGDGAGRLAVAFRGALHHQHASRRFQQPQYGKSVE